MNKPEDDKLYKLIVEFGVNHPAWVGAIVVWLFLAAMA